MMKLRCTTCNGRLIEIGNGMMMKKCSLCNGSGVIEKEELSIGKDGQQLYQNMATNKLEWVDTPKKRGRPRKEEKND